jgi:Apea-like HEPN
MERVVLRPGSLLLWCVPQYAWLAGPDTRGVGLAKFKRLERALREWVHDAVARLVSGPEPDITQDLRRWQRDTDGVVRDRERTARVWRHSELEAVQQLPSWRAVEKALQDNGRLRAQVNQLVGTAQGSSLLEVERLGRIVLPLPDEISDLEDVFTRRYERLDRFLAAHEIEHAAVWPINGLTSNKFPIRLEAGLEIDVMSDEELMAALNTGVLQPDFPNVGILFPEQNRQACLRYRYRLPKLIGGGTFTDAAQVQAIEERVNSMRDTLEQVFALLFANPVAISGRVGLAAEWTLQSGSVSFQPIPLMPALRSRQLHLDAQASAEVVRAWRQLRQPGLHKALALAVRRFSYQAHRQRLEDELVDILIASEALYLSDVDYRELNFRLALRAAALCSPQKLTMTRRNVFDLMKSAYDVRSKIVHGEEPKPKDLRLKGARVSLMDFVQATEEVVRQGLILQPHLA